MKNTVIPLDLIFIAPDSTIESIAANAEPYSLESIRSQGPVIAVLEIAGQAAGDDDDDGAPELTDEQVREHRIQEMDFEDPTTAGWNDDELLDYIQAKVSIHELRARLLLSLTDAPAPLPPRSTGLHHGGAMYMVSQHGCRQ